jgi:hypothetical protein
MGVLLSLRWGPVPAENPPRSIVVIIMFVTGRIVKEFTLT